MVRSGLATTLLLATTSTTFAAPTRIQQRANSHCRCTVLSTTETPFAPIYTPSAAHWTPAVPSPSSTPLSNIERDLCSDLGPALERLEFTYPDIYDAVIPSRQDEPRPRRTTFLLDSDVYDDIIALQEHPPRDSSSEDFAASKVASLAQSQPRQQFQNHIRCHTEATPETLSTTLAASTVTYLWATQIIVALLVFAFFVEAVHLVSKW